LQILESGEITVEFGSSGRNPGVSESDEIVAYIVAVIEDLTFRGVKEPGKHLTVVDLPEPLGPR